MASSFLWQEAARWAAEKPGAEALVFGERRISWSELSKSVDALACGMLRAGVARGDCVAQISMACPEFVIAFLAASRIGAVWVGLNPKQTRDELRRALEDCQPTLLLTIPGHAGKSLLETVQLFCCEFPCILGAHVIGGAEDWPSFDELYAEVDEELLARTCGDISPEDDCLLMYTSGSSGVPKGVLHCNRSLLANVDQEAPLFGIGNDSRILLHFPINHVAADVEIALCALHGGATIVLMDHFSPEDTLDTIEREGITVLGQVPLMYLLEFASPAFRPERLRGLKTLVWGGSAASPSLLEHLKIIGDLGGAAVITGYGATEFGGFITVTDSDEQLLPGMVGRVYDNCEIKIVGADRMEVPAGTQGEIAVRGPVLMKGYLNKSQLTAEVMDGGGWFYTRDAGYLDEEGRLYICGRLSEMYKSGGENVHPSEVEAVLDAHPKVMFSAVVGMPDALYDEVGHAFVMPHPGEELTVEELRLYCRDSLAAYKIPKGFTICPELPLLPNGKVDKKGLIGLVGKD
ncbi:MAG: acyl--CoA ligase [Candidatus Hydrogenedentes bacterium]|nr:acyl--CoA ligase [Candidatus Hydrogenedentota bacterium]